MDGFSDLQLVNSHTEPDNLPPKWRLDWLSRETLNGGIYVWGIGFDGQNLITIYGPVTSNGITNERKVETNSTGKSLSKQAFQDGSRQWHDKILQGYGLYYSVDESKKVIKPMLSGLYETGKKYNWPLYANPKYDGFGMLGYLNDKNEIILQSRQGKPITFLNHIRQDLFKLIGFVRERYNYNNIIFDGEGYVHRAGFNKISSIIRKELSPDPDEIHVKYYIYDIVLKDQPYIQRVSFLSELKTLCSDHLPNIVFIGCLNINNDSEAQTFFQQCLDEGYEGAILRKGDSVYVPDSRSHMFKMKKFFTAEGVVSAIESGKGREKGKAILCVTINEKGDIVRMRPEGDFETRGHIFNNSHNYVGKWVTYKYQELNPDTGIPRHPVAIGIRDFLLS